MIEIKPIPWWMFVILILGLLMMILGAYITWTSKSKQNRLIKPIDDFVDKHCERVCK